MSDNIYKHKRGAFITCFTTHRKLGNGRCVPEPGHVKAEQEIIERFKRMGFTHLADESMATQTQWIGGGMALLVLVVLLLLFVGGGRRPNSTPSMAMPLPTVPLPMPNTVVQQPVAGPPLPPEGLPPGWTMEQWAWYGEDYLKNR